MKPCVLKKELAWTASTQEWINEMFCLIGMKSTIFEVFHFYATCICEQRKTLFHNALPENLLCYASENESTPNSFLK